MEPKVYTIDEIKQKLTPVFKKHNVKKAVLFGSYAKGIADGKSDIDIMVESNLRGLAFYGSLEDVVVAIGKSVDLLERRQITEPSKIQQEIKNTGVVIYG